MLAHIAKQAWQAQALESFQACPEAIAVYRALVCPDVVGADAGEPLLPGPLHVR